MIRKETENGWILFAQHDHARLAADIMKFWGNSRFASFNPFEEVLFSIQQHDNGWKEGMGLEPEGESLQQISDELHGDES